MNNLGTDVEVFGTTINKKTVGTIIVATDLAAIFIFGITILLYTLIPIYIYIYIYIVWKSMKQEGLSMCSRIQKLLLISHSSSPTCPLLICLLIN